jgi:Vitamin K-dependent gamma-carboxylase
VSVSGLVRNAWQRWELLWFRPVAPHPLALLRIMFGALAVVSHLALWPDLFLLFGSDGPMPLDVAVAQGRATRFSVLDLADDLASLQVLMAAGAAVLLAWTVGWKTRWTGPLATLVLVSLHHRNLWFQHGGDRVIRVAVLMLALAPCGATLSVDAWRLRRRAAREGAGTATPLVAVWPLRLFQLQWMVIYAFTGVDKLRGVNWIDGTALYFALSDMSFQRFPQQVEPVLQSAWGQAVCQLLTYVTLAWEVAFAPLVLWAPARMPMLAAGVALHLGIAATISVGSFSFAMMAGYLAFLSPGAVQRRVDGWLSGARHPT